MLSVNKLDIANVPQIMESFFNTLTSPVENEPLPFSFAQATLARITIYVSSPSSATGQAATTSLNCIDNNGVTNTLNLLTIGPGGSLSFSWTMLMGIGQQWNYSIAPPGSETFLSEVSVSICLEALS